MVKFLSCDWGTSAIRLRLIQGPDLAIGAEVNSDQGISKTFAQWQATGPEIQSNRLTFYLTILAYQVQQLETQLETSLAGVPVVISGMASSSIGMLELPYQSVPFNLDGSGLTTKIIAASPEFAHQVYLISGVNTPTDVMRGEETQLIGFASQATPDIPEQVYVFPGTHSKHIWVKQKQVVGFKTYMTGEFFSLLSKQSILRTSVAPSSNLAEAKALAGFKAGVQAGKGANLLQVAFQVRTNELFNKFTKAENLHFLSGLLIGLEVQELVNTTSAIYLCGGVNLHTPYATALQELQLTQALTIFPAQVADEAVIRGQYLILNKLT